MLPASAGSIDILTPAGQSSAAVAEEDGLYHDSSSGRLARCMLLGGIKTEKEGELISWSCGMASGRKVYELRGNGDGIMDGWLCEESEKALTVAFKKTAADMI